ncbi:hypothetical protein EE612_029000 [Oryza sativa]|nr:hypothetical protein EE612_029000 [Oryza sativa]
MPLHISLSYCYDYLHNKLYNIWLNVATYSDSMTKIHWLSSNQIPGRLETNSFNKFWVFELVYSSGDPQPPKQSFHSSYCRDLSQF